MADFLDPQDYYIFTSESFGSDQPVPLSFVEDEGVIRTVPGKRTVWSLQVVDREKGIYTGKHIESGYYGHIAADSVTAEDRLARHEEEPQEWKLGRTDDGYSICRSFGDKEFFVHLDDEGRVTASPASAGRIQSFVFKPANE